MIKITINAPIPLNPIALYDPNSVNCAITNAKIANTKAGINNLFPILAADSCLNSSVMF